MGTLQLNCMVKMCTIKKGASLTLLITATFVGSEPKAELATHILQFTFVGCEGFEFPVAYYTTAQVDPVTLFHMYWDIIYALQQITFYVHMAICDGAKANRVFIAMHFQDENDALSSSFTTTNPYSGHPHSFMMDSSVSYFNIEGCCTPKMKPCYFFHRCENCISGIKSNHPILINRGLMKYNSY